jgi:hypothetical protein
MKTMKDERIPNKGPNECMSYPGNPKPKNQLAEDI